MKQVLLSKPEFKALSSETRTSILKMLSERNYTLSELSSKMDMSPPTIKQHTKVLVEAGLIELNDEGRKWKYYSLTEKGKDVLNSGENKTNIMIILSSTIVVLFTFAIIFSAIFPQSQMMGTEGKEIEMPAFESSQSDGINSIIPGVIDDMATITGGNQAVKTEESGYCKPLFKVEYQTDPLAGITASEAYETECTSIISKEECEKKDIYRKETENFGDSDGIPDCEWKEQ